MEETPTLTVTPPYVAGPLRLRPFHGVRLASARISDPASARAFARPYRDVSDRLAQWQARGLLDRDAEPALYLHEYAGSGMIVRGLVGVMDVSRRATRPEDRAVLPHEGIYPAQADDLADRMGEMAINPGPILLVQRSPQPLRALLTQVREAPPAHEFVDRAGHAHRLWAIRDPMRLAEVDRLLAPTTALIADGHHRYAAYLRLQQRSPGTAADRGLTMLVDHDDTPLFLGAMHRVLDGTSIADVTAAAVTLHMGTVVTSRDAAVAALSPHHLVATDGEKWVVLDCDATSAAPAVQVLHDQIIPLLGRGPSRVSFHHTVTGALDAAHTGSATRTINRTVFLLPAVGLDQVHRLALDGHLLPEKATSFQPKPPFGVLLRSLHDG